MFTVTLPIELTNRNDGRGHAWYRTAKERERIEWRLRSLGHQREPFPVRVDVVITRVLGKGQRLWDGDSVLRGNAKELLDSLVALGWFEKDDSRWIRNVDGRQDASRRSDGPCVVIEVKPIDE